MSDNPSDRQKAWEKAFETWQKQTYQKSIAQHPERQDKFQTSSKIDLSPVFTPLDLDETKEVDNIGFPGCFPFTRGVQPTMYRGKFWTMRQYAGFGSAEESNERYKYLLSQGQTGLSVAFDLPTQMGYDSDHPISVGEVGKVGVAIDSLADMEILCDGLPLDRISVSMTINATAPILLCLYLAVAEKRGISWDKLSGTIQNDILKEYIARGTYIYPPKGSMRLITDTFAFARKIPHWNMISISGYHIREAGSTAVQEVAFTLADGIAYVEAAIRAGLHIDEFASQLSFFFNVHNNFLEEVAKFRAARRIWAKIVKDRFGSLNPRTQMLRFHAQTAGSTLTAQQIENNVIRVTLQALAAVLGGAQSLHTNSRDEALSLPTQETVTIALRTQQIIAYESGVTDIVDPLGGSFAIEALTDQIEAKATEYLRKIAEMGGMVQAIQQGFPQREIQESAYQAQKAIESNEQIIVGVNRFTSEEAVPSNILKMSPQLEAQQKDKLKQVKMNRNQHAVERSLQKLLTASESSDDNLLPHILDAIRVYATLGEISDTLRKAFGVYEETIVL